MKEANETLATIQSIPPPRVGGLGDRDIEEVPFVELADNRLQGVVSSGSDIERVYCCFIEAGTLNYYSSTNNNRPDAGLEKRLRWLAEAAYAQFGCESVVRYLQLPVAADSAREPYELVEVVARHGRVKQEPATAIFSRFLNYLQFVEFPSSRLPNPDMNWFIEP